MCVGLMYAALAVALGAGGCRPQVRQRDEFYLQPLPVQQSQAYPETVTGRFVSLADFEEAPLARQPGHTQVRHFSISPAGAGAAMKYVVNITRTGAGALEADLPVGSSLVYRLPEVHDFSDYSLLSMAIYSRSVRDDLRVLLVTDRAGWESHPVLLRVGWNNVLIDIQRLKALADFDTRRVREIRLRFTVTGPGEDADRPVQINLDDIMLIDNQREILPLPGGFRLIRRGMDYDLHLPGGSEPIHIRQGDDGLWRMGSVQPIISLIARAEGGPSAFELGPATRPAGGAKPATLSPPREELDVMGRWRVGEVRILEHNAIRLRMSNTWYFPTSAGQWPGGGEPAAPGVRQIRWEYTFYPDGRLITDAAVNNVGGRRLATVSLAAPRQAMWSDGTRRRRLVVNDFADVGRWSFLLAAAGPRRKTYEDNYASPARLEVRMGDKGVADGDAGGDGFDETRGCYRLEAAAGHCRFYFHPPPGGLADPVVRVTGRWKAKVAASSEGLALRRLVRLADGSVLFVVPGLLKRPGWVEVTGKVPFLPQE